jgi:hypothetical protein
MSITMEADFCVEALQEAIARHGQPVIFNTDQGVQFTSAGFLDDLESRGIRVSMDGKGRFLDNIFIERLWRSLKYEDVFIKAYGSVAAARQGIGGWLSFYNEERLHQALSYRTPCAVFDGEAHEPVDNTSALKGCGVAHRLVGTELKRELPHVEKGLYLDDTLSPLIGREWEMRRDSLLSHTGSCPAKGSTSETSWFERACNSDRPASDRISRTDET